MMRVAVTHGAGGPHPGRDGAAAGATRTRRARPGGDVVSAPELISRLKLQGLTYER
jgi:hypothetical protein